MTDYRDLLLKYISLVHEVDGTYDAAYLKYWSEDVVLSEEQWYEIGKLTDEARSKAEAKAGRPHTSALMIQAGCVTTVSVHAEGQLCPSAGHIASAVSKAPDFLEVGLFESGDGGLQVLSLTPLRDNGTVWVVLTDGQGEETEIAVTTVPPTPPLTQPEVGFG